MKYSALLFLLTVSFSLRAQQLVMPGDHPDPSVVKIGDTYWASATTSNWFPAFPLMKSKDLVHWKQQGCVFDKMPDWADFYFWAPEITYENGKVYVYYAAHKKNGNLCVGVASADRPEGPYKDHGPLVCQEVGSIDAFPMRDENGKLFLIWKEDANSVGKPTPIWAQEMNEERTALLGQKKELFRNTVPWEGNLVEGVSMVRRGEYFYAIYAAAGCCGAACTYGVGIARSKTLLGPWEKYDRNPGITNTEQWSCPGHGTPIEKDGRYYFLYHAYDKKTNVFTGRQGLLIEYRYTPDNWIEFIPDQTRGEAVQPSGVREKFSGRRLSDQWQWSVFQNLQYQLRGGKLSLWALPTATGAFLGQKIQGGDYTANTVLLMNRSSATGGLGAVGDEKNSISALYKEGLITVLQVRDGKETVLALLNTEPQSRVYFRMQVRNGKEYVFFFSPDGRHYKTLNAQPIDGGYLPPWDRAVRVALISKGAAGKKLVVDKFSLSYDDARYQ